MSRFYVPEGSVRGNLINISGKEAHHIIDVMRLKASDKVVTFDGTGKEYAGFIKEIRRKSVTIEIVEVRTPHGRMAYGITLLQAIPKKDKMDYIVEKSTELGVSNIIPLVTERTIPIWDEAKKASSVQRWRKIAMEASKQCGRADIPDIGPVKNFADASADAAGFGLALIATLDDGAIKLKDALSGFGPGKIAIAVGPEGDFTPGEVARAKEGGFKVVSLGSRVLKSDTAGLFMLAILNYELTS
ncbi:MAG: 16S rRNA (uracil(1498)-N(3))-methyltransferase [Candidatus Omnitrophica bacterium]|nr:16S rRNA (uracil(1498)-N(3))-methyltransferase [Candidatus Omnitrophota bacterium]MBU0881276.1 16S rRNA (uracil(1498)-N(3))-methyltransferase [Candidatus Omnitrophota bacterium]MBU0895605.1 16S rRNA (uracil(1498)-N(3))-methyltransferase [Candidatus Omnitrophota bacterium]MBU1038187.1 16S rRNA (uracil(1498)-N(3))-methyltransferase [Candidatus Omnitrophota bacterium]MBU1808162.1 16S rRNA (uracil(1498)-N(3))-methyltransferase [Candidatus Omnitrophota bacterium]